MCPDTFSHHCIVLFWTLNTLQRLLIHHLTHPHGPHGLLLLVQLHADVPHLLFCTVAPSKGLGAPGKNDFHIRMITDSCYIDERQKSERKNRFINYNIVFLPLPRGGWAAETSDHSGSEWTRQWAHIMVRDLSEPIIVVNHRLVNWQLLFNKNENKKKRGMAANIHSGSL